MKQTPTLLKQVLSTSVVFWFGMASMQVAAQTPTPALTPTVTLNAPAATSITTPAVDALAENPYGLAALWAQGDWVAKTTLLLLLIMSLASWYVLISKLVAQNRMKTQTRAAEQTLANAKNLREGADALSPDSPYHVMMNGVLEDVRMHPSVASQVDLNTWAAQSIERIVGAVQSQSQNGLAVLATVGSTAPFVGLFGTVWGIYNALVKIGASGQASIDKVAGPIGEALIMTAIGLAVAVPAVLGYNWLVRRNKTNMDGVRNCGSDLRTTLLRLAEAANSVVIGHPKKSQWFPP